MDESIRLILGASAGVPVSWQVMLDILVLLGAALLLGTVAEQLRQSAILGYLVAGTVVGPAGFGLVTGGENVHVIAELGVAMLLFSIGLEFSFNRLRRLGKIALVGGSSQILITMALGCAVSLLFGLGLKVAVAIGAMLALSSTACVLRLLVDRKTIDSGYGRNSLGILLMQDIAVVPLVLLMTVLASGGSFGESMVMLGTTTGLGVLLIGAFLVVFRYVVPRLFNIKQWAQNRDLPVLLAIVMAIGSALAAYELGISPAMGAFVAGVLLGGSPFAVQIRADVTSLRTLFVTLFFASVGMLGEPAWVLANWPVVGGTVAAIIVGKAMVVALVVRMLGHGSATALASGLCLAQVGEFSFVLAEIGRGDVFSEYVFDLIVSSTILTLFLTPFLIALAPRLTLGGSRLLGRAAAARGRPRPGDHAAEPAPARGDDASAQAPAGIFIIGFGPTGQQAADLLSDRYRDLIRVIDLNPRNAKLADLRELSVQVGDATRREVLEHAGIHHAAIVLITLPDANASRTAIHHCRHLAPHADIIARARYHVVRWELQLAGALKVVDEELAVGRNLAKEARRHLQGRGT
ncbi:MAG: cation:proton antiporter [Phycisphaeraceae bacterium]